MKKCQFNKTDSHNIQLLYRPLKQMAILPVLLLLAGGSASAQQVHDWNGIYLGAFLGAGNAQTVVTGNRFTWDSGSSVNIVNHDYSGNTYGGLLGINFQEGNFVTGLELELASTSFDSHLVFNSDNDIDNVDLNWYGVAAGRIGIAVQKTFLYAKGGIAFGEFNNVGGDMDAAGFDLEDAHIKEEILFGYAVGAGLEHAISDKVSLRVEYMRMDFEDYAQANADPAVPQQQYHVDNGVVGTWKFAISMKF